jgi:hypothetical protein
MKPERDYGNPYLLSDLIVAAIFVAALTWLALTWGTV